MLHLINSESVQDLVYADYEINRSIATTNGDFMAVDNGAPIRTGIDIARDHGRISLLDAGCGTGLGLRDLKEQINFRAPIQADRIEAVGVSLTDLSDRLDRGYGYGDRMRDGYIELRVGNLATTPLEPAHFDVAYSYQVLLHNDVIEPIVSNILSSVKEGGVFYCDTLVEQQDELSAFAGTLDPEEWSLQSVPITQKSYTGTETRMMNKITRLSQIC